ncbi:hypothetical protein GE061_015818 [Apolygus lucorum]|uniref:Uncharacterized protein n=1 Tax=Apolygus lucorum TaxID=248454 RepID=A0A6A4JBP9_APOLU|nr:hypothetical protein GE061_015818 [Apolygus lucorum]
MAIWRRRWLFLVHELMVPELKRRSLKEHGIPASLQDHCETCTVYDLANEEGEGKPENTIMANMIYTIKKKNWRVPKRSGIRSSPMTT